MGWPNSLVTLPVITAFCACALAVVAVAMSPRPKAAPRMPRTRCNAMEIVISVSLRGLVAVELRDRGRWDACLRDVQNSEQSVGSFGAARTCPGPSNSSGIPNRHKCRTGAVRVVAARTYGPD